MGLELPLPDSVLGELGWEHWALGPRTTPAHTSLIAVGGEAGGWRGWGSEPQPRLEQADAGRARHDGQLPFPRRGGSSRGQPRGGRGVGLSPRGCRAPVLYNYVPDCCSGRNWPVPWSRNADVSSACLLCVSINVNGLRSVQRELFFPGPGISAQHEAGGSWIHTAPKVFQEKT